MTNGSRRPFEVAVVVHRPGAGGPEYLVLLRSPDQQGYWHLVAGGVEWGEEAAGRGGTRAARGDRSRRRTSTTSGSTSPTTSPKSRRSFACGSHPGPSGSRSACSAPPHRRRGSRRSTHEHVDYRWCDVDGAVALLRYPEPREAVRAAHAAIGGTG